MWDILEALLKVPVLPGTVLLTVCGVYWLLLIAGAVDLDLADFDLDADLDAGSPGWGTAALKFLNVDGVPLMIWATAFAPCYVAAAILFDRFAEGDSLGRTAATIAASAAIALVATKLLTQPLRGKFDTVEPNRAETLIGRTCVVTTSEVTDRFGQARFEAEGAPLLLHVRGEAGALAKNDVAVITAYDADRRVYLVSPAAAVAPDPVARGTV